METEDWRQRTMDNGQWTMDYGLEAKDSGR